MMLFFQMRPLSSELDIKGSIGLILELKNLFQELSTLQKFMFGGCFSSHGFGALYLFKDNLNAKKMIKIYKTVLMKSVRHFGFTNNNEWWLQEDNDSKHMANI